MQIKVYVPETVDIPNEYLPALAKRANDQLPSHEEDVSASRGHILRQAVRDGLLRGFEHLLHDNGNVDLFCDPHGEIPLEIDGRTFTLSELRETLQTQTFPTNAQPKDQAIAGKVPKRRAA